jgi:hypothetical protein
MRIVGVAVILALSTTFACSGRSSVDSKSGHQADNVDTNTNRCVSQGLICVAAAHLCPSTKTAIGLKDCETAFNNSWASCCLDQCAFQGGSCIDDNGSCPDGQTPSSDTTLCSGNGNGNTCCLPTHKEYCNPLSCTASCTADGLPCSKSAECCGGDYCDPSSGHCQPTHCSSVDCNSNPDDPCCQTNLNCSSVDCNSNPDDPCCQTNLNCSSVDCNSNPDDPCCGDAGG